MGQTLDNRVVGQSYYSTMVQKNFVMFKQIVYNTCCWFNKIIQIVPKLQKCISHEKYFASGIKTEFRYTDFKSIVRMRLNET